MVFIASVESNSEEEGQQKGFPKYREAFKDYKTALLMNGSRLKAFSGKGQRLYESKYSDLRYSSGM